MSKQQLTLLLLCIAMAVAAAVCLFLWWRISRMLLSQQAAERWQGDSEMPYKQISCFLPTDKEITLEQIGTFRNAAMTKLKEGSLDITGSEVLMQDCWSTNGTAAVKGTHGKGQAAVIAVGGNYFDFHPIRLINGDYLHPNDLMEDRVLLDEELAWLLFGGTSLQGMEVRIEGVPYVVAGVIEREKDFASKKAYSPDEMVMFMSYEGLRNLNEELKINCYEYVMANPVKNFALGVAQEKFPIGRGEILCNTDRYSFNKMLDIVRHYGNRSTQSNGVLYPYWENAARISEDWAALFWALGMLLPIFPIIMACIWLVGGFKRGRKKMAEEIMPEAKEKAEEAVRVRQRKRWLKKHGESEQENET